MLNFSTGILKILNWTNMYPNILAIQRNYLERNSYYKLCLSFSEIRNKWESFSHSIIIKQELYKLYKI